MQKEKTEGIVLKMIPYLQDSQIAKIFTKNLGLISVLFRKKKEEPIHPLIYGEFAVKRSIHSELFRLEDFSFFSSFEKIRLSLDSIRAFSEMAQALFASQKEEKKEDTFTLFLLFVKALELSKSPYTIVTSFYLKLLQQEGLLQLQKNCLRCEKPASSLFYGESLCEEHSPTPSFSEESWNSLFLLTFSKKLKEIQNTPCPTDLCKQVRSLFRQSMEVEL